MRLGSGKHPVYFAALIDLKSKVPHSVKSNRAILEVMDEKIYVDDSDYLRARRLFPVHRIKRSVHLVPADEPKKWYVNHFIDNEHFFALCGSMSEWQGRRRRRTLKWSEEWDVWWKEEIEPQRKQERRAQRQRKIQNKSSDGLGLPSESSKRKHPNSGPSMPRKRAPSSKSRKRRMSKVVSTDVSEVEYSAEDTEGGSSKGMAALQMKVRVTI